MGNLVPVPSSSPVAFFQGPVPTGHCGLVLLLSARFICNMIVFLHDLMLGSEAAQEIFSSSREFV